MIPRILLALAPYLFAAAAHAGLPTVQPGKWVLRGKVNGAPHEVTICGNPLDKVAEAIAAAREREKAGCHVTQRTPVPRTVSVVVECPGRERAELTINSGSMQSVMIDMRRAGRVETLDAERVGACD